VERVLATAADAYLDDTRRAKLSARLLAVAVHLGSRGDEAHAHAAAAAARALAAGAPAGEIPFVRGLVWKAFPPQPSVPPRPDAGAAESPLIIAPR